jgi:hypothetical protein
MQDLSEIHLLPEELEEYSKFSRMMKLLKKLRLRRQAELEAEQAEEAMRLMQQGLQQGQTPTSVTPVAPSATGLNAAPIASQPEPISQVAMPKPVNATLQPLTTETPQMSTRIAAAKPNNPFERMMMRKFAALADDGTPSLAEATGIGLAGLGGAALGHRMAPVGSRWMAQEALGPYLGKDMSELKTIMAPGGRTNRLLALEKLRDAASEMGLPDNSKMFWTTEGRILNRGRALEEALTSKLTKGKMLPFKILGGLGAALGAAALIKKRNEGPMAALVGATPADASLGAYPEAQMTDMGGQYPGAY